MSSANIHSLYNNKGIKRFQAAFKAF